MDGFDVIVVGGGTAGCVLAERLSEDGDRRVLLLEAGQRRPPEAAPAAWLTLQGTSADWGGNTVPQAETGTSIPWPRGKGLGGSSAINGMVFCRGHRSSYDRWPAGWRFDDLLPYLRRSENAEGRDPALRGVDGPLTVGPSTSPHPITEAGLAAAAETGFPLADDVSGGLSQGFGWSDLNVVDGRRQSAADAYLAPALDRANLTVVTEALVHRLRFARGRCTGVDYSVDGEVATAWCDQEVVLTAGTVGSPVLLLRSGIGPPAHLHDVGVDPLVDLPGVGANLHDHPKSTVVYRPARPIPSATTKHGDGIGLILGEHELQIQILHGPTHASSLPDPGPGYSIAFAAMAPRSRGSVRLADANAGTPPRLDPDYYGDLRDLDAMAAGLDVARTIGQAAALAPWRHEEVLPGPAVHDPDSVRAYLRQAVRTYSHQVGTCAIGEVVDTDLHVYGVDGLRVADASIMPSIVSANTVATVYGIAERAAAISAASP